MAKSQQCDRLHLACVMNAAHHQEVKQFHDKAAHLVNYLCTILVFTPSTLPCPLAAFCVFYKMHSSCLLRLTYQTYDLYRNDLKENNGIIHMEATLAVYFPGFP